MFTIRSESPKDFTSIREVHLRAFEGEGEANLVEAVRASDNFVPELSLVAVTDTDEVVGHILFSIVGIETDTGMVPTLALAPMAVLPEYQHQGIGSALVREGLRRAAELGFEHVVVLGHPNFYPKFGFVPSTAKGIQSPFQVPEEVFMVHEIQAGSLDSIRGTVKYPPAFDHV
ncbi:GNAT family N-acetyltransferase [Alicyclobacillus macrosporangiidus]|uniref:Putative acetyltransferase n=1 Tax=Alicyclobacillus macrosporangiidus TaxID=392015 RepID=A0A1I7HY72_9BACL|nr:N-acetyltransferase [Alicyclobacillus macrosporangiidus]SFU65436.1 putative acetyltransferase [Alicyclobacillus macrosporangiidus]